uniref:NADH dehydrogenase [ubiquinone] 1 alpha subcomplex subunit 5 n=1 Tax=Clastoptera arizonana TaxID=38151 RepID=A0A1B6CSI1_9HEMI
MAKFGAEVLKKTTGLTGLLVAKNPRHELGVLYTKILRCLEKMPESAAYRKHTAEITTKRQDIINKADNIAEIEKQIDCGQIEEVIIQAENELRLARKMLTWKPWEPLLREPPPNQWTWPPVK